MIWTWKERGRRTKIEADNDTDACIQNNWLKLTTNVMALKCHIICFSSPEGNWCIIHYLAVVCRRSFMADQSYVEVSEFIDDCQLENGKFCDPA